eukprot:89504_1
MFHRFSNIFGPLITTTFAATVATRIEPIKSKTTKECLFGSVSKDNDNQQPVYPYNTFGSNNNPNKNTYNEQIDKLMQQIEKDNIKFIRFEACNINGQSLGMLVPARNCEHFLRNGFPFVTFTLMVSINTSFALDSISDTGYRNIPVWVDVDSYKVIPWIDDVPTASLLISAQSKYNNLYPQDVRTIAKNTLNKLNNEYGLDILSAIEHEFSLLDETFKPISNSGCYDMFRINKYIDFFSKLDDNFQLIGVECDRLHSEVASGQYEITTLPKWNINGCDDAFWIKNGIREMAKKYKNWNASFITHLKLSNSDSEDGFNVVEDDSGAHFNFSLWDKNKKHNAFWDDSKNDLSQIALYFIGGILKHIGAISALVCPTTICYETRFDSPWVSSYGNWGRYNRTALIRVKPSKNGKNTHFEFRLPSSLANPYMVMTAVICAGMDGIKNKILPPNETTIDIVNENEREKCYDYIVPKTLTEALNELKNDTVFIETFGDLFISLYIDTKTMEIGEMETAKKNNEIPLCYSIM